MKALPILLVANALVLAAVVVLFVQQQDLESRLGSQRAESYRGEVVDAAGIDARLDSLERLLAAGGRSELLPAELADPAPLAGEDPPLRAGPEEVPGAGERGPSAEGGEPPRSEFDSGEMEVFRQKVRRALDLNREEDWVNRVIGRLDNLAKSNRIAPLAKAQGEKVARKLIELRRQTPAIWRKLQESGALENTSREERREIIRAEYESLRMVAQRSLELVVPAADAKTILEDTASDRGMWRGPPPGPAQPARSAGRSR